MASHTGYHVPLEVRRAAPEPGSRELLALLFLFVKELTPFRHHQALQHDFQKVPKTTLSSFLLI